MATNENQQATAAREVLVKLSSNGPKDLPWPERRIKLTRDITVVPIGRASKVRSKGFVASKSNGWFDSPVMSRDHAELVADLDKRSVIIRDIGSLHGTFLNKETDRIPDSGERTLTDGDTITFGVAIWRGKDTYAPTTVEVGLEFTDMAEATGNTFKVPDYVSDVDDSDSMSDVGDEPDITMNADLSLHRLPSDHIDLTREEEKRAEVADSIAQLDGPSDHRVIDLTSPPRAESPEDFITEMEDEMSVEDRFLLGSDLDGDTDSSIRLTDEEDSEMSDDEDDNADSDESESASEDEEQEEEYSSDDEILSDGDNGLFVWHESDDEDFDVSTDKVLAQEAVELPPITYQPVYGAPLAALNTPVPQVLPPIVDTQIPSTLSLPAIITKSAREPSPSDAAMMKSSIQPQVASKPTFTTLKEKTGKHAFFDAREENKATLARNGSSYPSPPNAAPAADSIQKTPSQPSPQKPEAQGSADNDTVQPIHTSQPVTKSPWHSTGDYFLNTPHEDNLLGQTHHETYDEEEAMTSAYQYNLWKQAKASQEDETHPHRRIRINDIVMDQEDRVQPQGDFTPEETPRKRKAAAISTTTHEEETWQEEQRKDDENADSVVQPISPPDSPQAPVSQLSSEPALRPTKRMRRIAERVGYAALGGATVGAMIVTSLIYTAPSFA